MIEGSKLNTNYKDLIDLLVCDSENSKCMFDECKSCPGKDFLLETLIGETDDMPEEIVFNQWVSSDKDRLITEVFN